MLPTSNNPAIWHGMSLSDRCRMSTSRVLCVSDMYTKHETRRRASIYAYMRHLLVDRIRAAPNVAAGKTAYGAPYGTFSNSGACTPSRVTDGGRYGVTSKSIYLVAAHYLHLPSLPTHCTARVRTRTHSRTGT